MYRPTSTRSLRSKNRILQVLLSILAVSVALFGGNSFTGFAMPPNPIEPPPIGEPPPWQAPADGFGWSVPSRFGNDLNGDGMIDYHYNQTTMLYEPSHIYPAYWPMDFNGCQTEGDADTPTATTNTYHWALNGQTLTGNVCRFTYKPGLSIGGVALTGFPAQGTYHVTLSVTDPSGNPVPAGRTTPFEQDVYIRDYLIVSLGDSIASGEGNPDRPQVYDPPTWYWPFYNLITPAKWQDERCHRSANAGAAQAALALEASDRKTSVTFISFACSGATVRAQLYDNPYDSNTPRGSGLLGPYRGQQVPDGFPYDFSQYIPSQISQLTTALTPPAGMAARQMDALILTAGGNDMHFGDIATACLFADDCWNDGTAFNESPNNGPYDLRTMVFRTLGMAGENSSVYRLDSSFELLDQQIDALNPAHVYITEYPDQTRDDNGFYCRMLDDIFWPLDLAITESEAQDSAQIALTNLNDTVRLAASLNGWQYVDGITSYSVDTEVEAGTPGPFVRDSAGKGHGYCASDNWIRRADEAELIQGPFLRFATKGTLHPTLRGTEVYKQRILRYLLPDLGIGATNTAPTFSASFSNGTLTNVSGANGWTVQSCAGATCYPEAVLNVTASDDTAIQGASIAVNGASGCALGGVTCSAPVPSTDGKQVTWSIEITAEGAYTFQFTAQDNSNQTATFSQQIKTDFQNPAFDSEAEALSVNEGDTLALDAPVFDPSGGPLALEWDIDQNGSFETAGDTPAFSAANIDGPALISIPVRATDQAGRAATGQVAINVQNVAPTAAIGGVPASSPEGTPVTLAGSFTDPASADTASYAWSVTKNGQPFTTGSGASFSFTPDDNGSYGVTLAVTDDDGGVGSASATVLVTNVAPTPAFIDPPATIPEGSELCVYASVTDPGSADTMASYAWSMVKNGAALPSSDMAPSSMAGGVCYYPRDNGVYTIKLVATDDDGGVGTASVDIDVTNVAPRVGMTDVPAGQVEGRLLALIGNVIDPGTEDTFTYDWNVTKNGSAFATGSERILTFTPDDNGSYVVSLDVTDDDGGTGSATSQTIQVANLAPTVSNLETSATTIQEGDSILFTGVVADASAADTFTVTIDWGDGSNDTVLSLAAGATGFSTNHTYADDNPSGTASDLNTISVSVEDDDHGTGSASTTLTVENVAPVAAITAPAESTVYALGSAVSLQLAYTDANASDGHTYTIDWDDGVVDTGSLAGGSFSTSHQYTAAGVYTVQATVADDDTGSDTKTVMVVVYDPTSGYVTGAGRIYSPAGAYVADPTLEGMAQFAFVSKYRRGANVPDGNTEFQFQAGQFRFRSDSYDWLVVAGARAQFKGNGSVNGVSGYTFLLTAVDGDLNGGGGIDKFRIKIWDASGVVYDNVLGASDDLEGANPQEITSGTIMIRNN